MRASLYLDRAIQLVEHRLIRLAGTGATRGHHFSGQGIVDPPALRGLARSLRDAEWLEVLTRGIEHRAYRGVVLPGFPPAELQASIVGSSGARTLEEAFNFYRAVKRAACRYGLRLGEEATVLDFGCGWGRIIRLFLREIAADRLHGVDVDPELIALCRERVQYGTYEVIASTPPLDLAPHTVDLVYAYSVFSHLSEAVHLRWIAEFARILRPGGLVVVTTQGRHFLDLCARLRRPGAVLADPWRRTLATCFVDTGAARAAYDRGEFLYEATGGGPTRPASSYGEALIPPRYVARVWSRHLEPRAFLDDRWLFPQALIVAQKRGP